MSTKQAGGCRLSADWSFRGLQAIVLENRLLRTTVLPDHGAKVHEFVYKPSDRDFLYHNPRNPPRTPVYGVNVDNWWSGGIDEAIPTGHVCVHNGEEYPYLGEVWSQPWGWEVVCNTPERVEVHLWCDTVIAPLRVERWHYLLPDEPILHSRHRVTNTGIHPFDFLWGIHPAFAVTPASRIDLPAGKMWVAESTPDWHLGQRGTTYTWPEAHEQDGRVVDMRFVPPPEVGWQEFHHAIELHEGWAALTDTEACEGVALTFPLEVLNTVWLWLVYGGWRDLYSAALEAWTGYPAKLSDALSEGRCARLAPGQTLDAETRLIAYQGVSGVKTVQPDGTVIGIDS
jgi:galactose mutarotase-like enzyme